MLIINIILLLFINNKSQQLLLRYFNLTVRYCQYNFYFVSILYLINQGIVEVGIQNYKLFNDKRLILSRCFRLYNYIRQTLSVLFKYLIISLFFSNK